MKKKMLKIISCMFLIISLLGCEKESNNSYGNCSAIECIKNIKPEYTVEQINEVIGVDGVLISEEYNTYYWELSENEGVEVSYYSTKNGEIKINFDKNTIANKKVDFSRLSEFEKKVNDGLTYDDVASYFGNVDGVMTENTSYSTKYIWVDKETNYMEVVFSKTNGKCTHYAGVVNK